MRKAQVVIVTPASADANNGNWRTAQRWSGFLADDYRVRVAKEWDDGDEALMIALHARRSATSIAAWRARHPTRPLLLVLTGTDLYRDIPVDGGARRSLELADRLVVLNERGLAALPERFRPKASVLLQSCPARVRTAKTQRLLRVVMVGHLRDEKRPDTFFEAVRRLADRADIVFEHVGAGLDPALAAEARALMAGGPRPRWVRAPRARGPPARGRPAPPPPLPRPPQGGAPRAGPGVRHAPPGGPPRLPADPSPPGAGAGGYFPIGGSAALAALLRRMRDEPASLAALQAQCDARAPLFDPTREREALRSMLDTLLR